MSVQDVAFPPSLACFCIAFLVDRGRGEGHGVTTCLKTVV